jgi:anthranilate 1,2-dioxygenase large subunit
MVRRVPVPDGIRNASGILAPGAVWFMSRSLRQRRERPLMEPRVMWPRPDYSRVPYELYHDPAIYAQEQERIFRGPPWNFLGLEVEIPNVGDFRTSFVGDTPVVYNRGEDGKVNAFVNRCAHRGAQVVREQQGNVKKHVCIYHRWCYDLTGNLIGVPFRRGVRGKGGMDPDFDPNQHGLRKLRVDTLSGVIFVTFSDRNEPLTDYLGPQHTKHLARLFHKPVRILGYERQRIFGNWKLYAENLRDQYHGSLLHEFQVTFGITRVTQKGGAWLDPRHRHNISYSEVGTDRQDEADSVYKEAKVDHDRLRLCDTRMLDYRRDYDDPVSISIASVFPNACFQQINNSLATRQIRTRGIGCFDLYWTLFGYADDDAAMTEARLLQANMIGPAGLISMEDGEAIEIVHRATAPERGTHAVIEMGGHGAFPPEIDFKASDIPVRGFWSYYAELMGFAPEGAIR